MCIFDEAVWVAGDKQPVYFIEAAGYLSYVTFALDDDGLGVMQQAIEDGGGER